jgi:hypothetical protein
MLTCPWSIYIYIDFWVFLYSRIYAGPTSDEDSAADVADSDGDDADDFDTPEKNKKRQDTYNQAM